MPKISIKKCPKCGNFSVKKDDEKEVNNNSDITLVLEIFRRIEANKSTIKITIRNISSNKELYQT